MRLALLGNTYGAMSSMLDVTPGFVSHAKKAYATQGIAGLSLEYQGSVPLISPQDRQAVVDWLKIRNE
jgi:hypothetical protein